MDVNADLVISGLLDEIKRLTLEMVALRSMLLEQNHEEAPDGQAANGVES